jgi:hypothetical protein
MQSIINNAIINNAINHQQCNHQQCNHQQCNHQQCNHQQCNQSSSNKQSNKQVMRIAGGAKTIKKDKDNKQQACRQIAMKAVEQHTRPKLAIATSQCDSHFLQFMQACDTNPNLAFEILMDNATITGLTKAAERAKSTHNEQNRIEGICEASNKQNKTKQTKQNKQSKQSGTLQPGNGPSDPGPGRVHRMHRGVHFHLQVPICFVCFVLLHCFID